MGVLHPDARNKSKIIFTTRSQDKEVGEETLKSHPHIPRLAKIVAEECKGLPLALITLRRAMAGEKDPSNWNKVLQDLSKFPAEISDGECGKKKNKTLVYNDVSRLKEAQEIPNLKVAEKMSFWDENVEKFPKTLGKEKGHKGMQLSETTLLQGELLPRLHEFWQQPGFDLLHIDWAASVFADWGCAALFPCTCAGSQSIYFHGADTAGKVAASFSFLAGIGFCGLPLLSGFFT
ncbi:putative disease resistance protein [Vitis vinifera]|uniref:Putative disease resistance protein n=1 Tax=Vitis vinifera TaxID=29760 RepID=A0A438HTZ7_VITVI|nr:putative disease resistance protein [Vitis vinifera]